MPNALAARYHEHGQAAEVLKLEPLAVMPPGPGQVRLDMLLAPINPADFGLVSGYYGLRRKLPAVAGLEGVGQVVETGEGVDAGWKGRFVLPPDGTSTWCESVCVDAAGLIRVSKNVPLEQAAMAAVNPLTALCLLEEFENLQAGDWIAQNAANSALGHLINQLAAARGVEVINLVRRPGAMVVLQMRGTAHVLVEGREKNIVAVTREMAGERGIALGINSVGGESAINLLKMLRPGATLVTVGGAIFEKVRFPARELIFGEKILRGFWRSRWLKTAPRTKVIKSFKRILDDLRTGKLHAPVEKTYPLQELAAALEHTSRGTREGKILLRLSATAG